MRPFSTEGAGGEATRCAGLIMAAGKGTRMKSDLAKVLHTLGGRPLIHWVLAAARDAGLSPLIFVLGHQADRVRETVAAPGPDDDLRFVLQEPQNGTGHAVQMAAPELAPLPGDVVVLSGDVPLIRSETLSTLLATHRREDAAATLLTTRPDDPSGYGRILRGPDAGFIAIREQRDASAEELAIDEVNSGIYCFRIAPLLAALEALRPDNDQGELYLTDAPAIMRRQGLRIALETCPDPQQIEGVNDPAQLAAMERLLAERRS